VRQAARQALDIGKIGYTEALGMRSLRERIAQHYHQAYGVSVPADRVAVTTGSSAGFILCFLSMFEAGDRVCITAGPFAGIEGVFEMAEGDKRVMVLIEMMSKPLAVALAPSMVRKLG
jgi:aspartate/methionine/tyrosine aminotransferase